MLYIIATPIGNLSDISFRAVHTLKSVDEIYCEDTRRTSILLNHYGINKTLIIYNKLNENKQNSSLIKKLNEQKNIALVSDAGTPLISDPGNNLIKILKDNKLQYTTIGGTCALISGLVLSGLDTNSFYFVGFLPDNKKQTNEILEEIKDIQATLVFYIPPHDLQKTIDTIYKVFGKRNAVLVREISKIYEEVVDFTLDEMPDCNIKGEMVLLVEACHSSANEEISLDKEKIKALQQSLNNLGYDNKDCLQIISKILKVNKKIIYKIIHT